MSTVDTQTGSKRHLFVKWFTAPAKQGWRTSTDTGCRQQQVRCCYLLGHGPHGARDRHQVVAAEVDFCKRGNVTDGQWELTEVVVGQVEAPQTGKSEEKRREKKGKEGDMVTSNQHEY